jgi:hypothetical protein
MPNTHNVVDIHITDKYLKASRSHMPSTEADNKIIISLLNKNADDMKHLHECVHDIGSQVNGIAVYFAGMQPQVHILDHAKLQQLFLDKEEAKKTRITAVMGIITSVFTAVILAGGAYLLSATQRDLQRQIADIAVEIRQK